MLAEKIRTILSEIEKQKDHSMPGNTYFMKNGEVLCCERKHGESRFPYSHDGYLLWAHSTGHIHAKDGLFNVFKPLYDLAEPSVEFFAGVKQEDGTYFPISVLGASKQLFEPFEVKRYLVYSLAAAYYIADTDFATFVVRAHMSEQKEIVFTFECINKTDKVLDINLISYFNPLLQNAEYDNMWTVGERRASYKGDGSFVMSREHFTRPLGEYQALVLNRSISEGEVAGSEITTSRESFSGSLRRELTGAECLKTGRFCEKSAETNSIASEILTLSVKDTARVDYVLTRATSEAQTQEILAKTIDCKVFDCKIDSLTQAETERFANMKLEFIGFSEDGPKDETFNQFVKMVQKQVDNCAMGKYYAEDMLGVRDVFQQLEQALLWDKEQAREKMLRALSFIDPSGRSPRQFSIPEREDIVPKMDLREFIDQGNWIISCFYSYLSWTGDFSILDETIGYYEMIQDVTVKKSDLKDSVLTHLIKIADYLERNIEREEGTNCLRILYGDWNDALDGLGKTSDEGKKYGTGVSVMASLHFYQNLFEMAEILKSAGGYEDKIQYYLKVREELAEGLLKYAVDVNAQGEKRLIHGWGDHRSYKIGSFADSDGVSRISFAPNAFWVSSGLIHRTPELKDTISQTIHALDSKYGLKTLTPAFDNTPGVGRIAGMLKGTAENDCVYVHATLFSVMALYGIGEADYAWEQLKKVLPIMNEQMTKTPFVMSNSYLDNPECGLHGQSAIDWYTGSGTVLLKDLVRAVLGVNPDLNGVSIQPAKTLPCRQIRAELEVKGCSVHFEYCKEGKDSRKFYLNDKLLESQYDELLQVEKIYIPNAELQKEMRIKVCE